VDLKIFGVLVAVVYCPPRIDEFLYYGPVLESLVDKYPTHVVLGDLNIDLLRDILASRTLLENFEYLSQMIVNDREPTHFQTGARPSLIDLFATNSPDDVGFFTQVDLSSCCNFHDLIYTVR
jgi:hypothetical protein